MQMMAFTALGKKIRGPALEFAEIKLSLEEFNKHGNRNT